MQACFPLTKRSVLKETLLFKISETFLKIQNISFSNIKILTTSRRFLIFISKIEKPLIETTLDLFRGNQIKTSKCLGFNRNTFY